MGTAPLTRPGWAYVGVLTAAARRGRDDDHGSDPFRWTGGTRAHTCLAWMRAGGHRRCKEGEGEETRAWRLGLRLETDGHRQGDSNDSGKQARCERLRQRSGHPSAPRGLVALDGLVFAAGARKLPIAPLVLGPRNLSRAQPGTRGRHLHHLKRGGEEK